MKYIKYPGDRAEDLLREIDRDQLFPDSFRAHGVAVVRGAIPAGVMDQWARAWKEFQVEHLAAGRKIDPYNPVVLHEALSDVLSGIYSHPALLDVMETLYPNLAFYGQRFVLKDASSRGSVFLHQDYPYDLGLPEKTSVFLPFAPMSADNGGLFFYAGTHHFGYLGDAGEINRDVLEPAWPVLSPAVTPGDIVLMHACTWHGSAPYVAGPDRIVAQITYQPASDPSSKELLRGTTSSTFPLGQIDREILFKRCRTSRLRELQEQLSRAP